jgi:ATP-binding cassette, subfamily B, bacterial RamA/AmfB
MVNLRRRRAAAGCGGTAGMPGSRLLLRMTWKASGWVIPLAAAGLAAAAAETALPAALGRSVDAIIAMAAGRACAAVPWAWVTGCAALAGVIACGEAFGQFATGATAGTSTGWLRQKLLRHILACGPRLTRRYQPGDIVSRMIGGAADAGGAPSGAVMAIVAVVPSAGSIAMLGLIDPWLAVAFAAGLPAVAFAVRSFVRDTSCVVLRYQRAQGAIAARLLDTMTGARTIAAAGTCADEIARVLAPLAQLRARGHETWHVHARLAAQSTLIVPILQVLVLAVGGLELAAHRITPGGLLAASQYAALGAGIGATISQLNRLARARSGAARVAELLGVAAPEKGTERLPPGAGRLEFRDVSVRASGASVIEGLDMVIPGGASVAVVGSSGAGKSTLAALAGRLIDPSHGEVLLDGVPLPQLAAAELRTAVIYAFERPALLGRTVYDVIRFGAGPPPPAGVIRAARAARADPFIRRLPMRYRTPAERAPLSGGEIQRLGLARALAHAARARVLVLDDAMSSLDTMTEMEVRRALTEHHGQRTKIIVTHRAATAAAADLVAWLDGGHLRALAPHHELWRDDPRYLAVFAASPAAPVKAAPA